MQEIWHGHQKLKDEVLSVHIIRSPLDSMCPYTTFDNSSRYGKLDHEAMLCQIRAYLDAGGPWPGHTRAGVRGAKLEEPERLQVIDWAAGEVSGQVPLAVTVYGHTVE